MDPYADLLSRFNDVEGNARGFLSFYAVHGTSIYENNTLVSGDNKGMAAYLYESDVEPDSMPGNSTFVAGFVQCQFASPFSIESMVLTLLDSQRW
jgi:hypothetical protein